ncbi:MAG: aldo/keto reductase [Ruminococcus sp.]|nr:aldo/keto reductase [Ruminococcus sp.]MCM1381925.1 aldo/keto reductase [Muribaculaceae bacterium]MCM1480076.1 aldo/keto reductase [Muribaculaceae bacterium]
MIYRKFQDMELSNLGMGTMRLPTAEGKYNEIDEKATAEMIEYALKNGVNYFDTAWGYHDGMSEIAVGKALAKYPRESFYLATKFPGYDLSNMDKVEEIFEKQLEKCGVEYFDFYLFHNVCEMNIEQYLDPKYGIDKYLTEQKKNGRIRHLGLSVHGSYDVLKRFLDAYGDHIEFCQVQLNWLDWDFQEAKLKVQLLNERNIPVWVMEPLRGGKLANLAREYESRLKELRPEEEIPAWSFRYLQGIEGVTVILSGMSNLEQVQKNIETFKTDKPLNGEESGVLAELADKMLNSSLPCTSCRYCTSHCPQGLDIPRLIELYNEHSFTGGGFIAPMALSSIPQDKQPSACVGCRSCEAVCPQQIKISEAMKDFVEKLK